MSFNFPSNPAINDVFEDAASGAAYVWAGTKWWKTKAATFPEPPPPLVTRLAPNNAVVGAASPLSVAVNGANFFATSVVRVDGVAVPTTFVSSTVLRFNYAIPSAAAVAQISVLNPDGQSSAAIPFTTTMLKHELLSIAPNTFAAGSPTATVTATGNEFTSASYVRVGNGKVPTTFVSKTTLTFDYKPPPVPRVDQARVVTAREITNSLPITVT